jgi:hypothetical protein
MKKRERERERKDSRRVGTKRKLWGRSKRHFISRRRKIILFLEGSQALPARPSDKSRILKHEARQN